MDRFKWFNKRNSNFIMDEIDYSDDEHEKISECFNSAVNHSKYDKQNYTQITRVYNKKTPPPNEKYIIDIAYKYLESIGLKQNKNHCVVEYWRHRLFGEKRTHTFGTHCHRDSYGPILAPVNTCIFYLRKDPTFRGSELEIYGICGRLASKPLHTSKADKKILMFDGSAHHRVLPYSGFGIRDCIVVMFETGFVW